MMYDDPRYCIKVNLIQQTPMIHFQARKQMTAGIGPRATEVKPKLDKFAALWYKSKNGGKPIPVTWMVEYNEDEHIAEQRTRNEALNYSMRIMLPNKKPKVDEPSKDVKSVYFANMGNAAEKKFQVFNSEPMQLYIRCFIPELKELLKACIPTFFLMHNFGMRQDKGLGGFITEGMTSDKARRLLKEWYNNQVVVVDYSKHFISSVKKDESFWIGEIGTIYKILKSGLNTSIRDPKSGKYVPMYIKSGLTEYCLAKHNINGEKAAMKQHGIAPIVFTNTKFRHSGGGSNNKERYIRGLFGYGQRQEWFAADSHNHKVEKRDPKTGEKIFNRKGNVVYEKEIITISPSEGSDIERVPSPLLFKVVDKCIFIIPREIEVYGKTFVFSSNMSKNPINLQIPDKDEFNMNDFMKWFVEWLCSGEREKIKGNQFSNTFEEPDVIKEIL